jgi:hypothetical protein
VLYVEWSEQLGGFHGQVMGGSSSYGTDPYATLEEAQAAIESSYDHEDRTPDDD